MAEAKIAELERIINEKNERIAELEGILSEMSMFSSGSAPKQRSVECNELIRALNHPGMDLHRVAGLTSRETEDTFRIALLQQSQEMTHSETFMQIIHQTNMQEQLGDALFRTIGIRGPSYIAWKKWKSTGFNL